MAIRPVFLWVIWSEKTHSLLETTEREREKRMRTVNRRGEEKRGQWGLERDRRQIRTREKTNYEKESWLQGMGNTAEISKLCCH